MRLICPNCEAQYEVSDEAIPAGGRDVQCSNCGNTWYQMPAGAASATDAGAARSMAPTTKVKAETVAAAVTAPEATMTADPVVTAEPTEAEKPKSLRRVKATEPEAAEPAVEGEPPRRKLDEGVVSVLREEAERETKARKDDAVSVEVPAPVVADPVPDDSDDGTVDLTKPLGPTNAIPVTDATPEMTAAQSVAIANLVAAIAKAPVEDPTPTTEDPAARQTKGRELLPDIEEIKSSLRSSTDQGSDDDEGDEEAAANAQGSRHGFRQGFLTMLLVGAILTTIYTGAERIAEWVPATEPAVRSYVSVVDSGRAWLDGLLRQATSKIQGDAG